MDHIIEYDKFIKELILEIPKIIAATKELNIDEKSDERDLVTEVDKNVESFLTKKILERFPDHEILGEETYNPEANYDKSNLWVIDPIDGTSNFIKQKNDFCTIISYFENSEPMLAYIYEVDKGDLYSSIKGGGVLLNGVRLDKPVEKTMEKSIVSTDIRRMSLNRPELFNKLVEKSFGMRSVGTSGLDGSRVLSGRFGAYVNYVGGPWDYSPFFLMCKELDLIFVNLKGEEMTLDGYSNYIVATKSAYNDFVSIMKELGYDE